MDTIRTIFPNGARTSTAQKRLAEAYKAVFEGRADQQDAEVVLADLAYHTGYFRITMPTADSAAHEIWFNEGARSVMARILRLVDIPPSVMAELAEAAKLEAMATMEAGGIDL